MRLLNYLTVFIGNIGSPFETIKKKMRNPLKSIKNVFPSLPTFNRVKKNSVEYEGRSTTPKIEYRFPKRPNYEYPPAVSEAESIELDTIEDHSYEEDSSPHSWLPSWMNPFETEPNNSPDYENSNALVVPAPIPTPAPTQPTSWMGSWFPSSENETPSTEQTGIVHALLHISVVTCVQKINL